MAFPTVFASTCTQKWQVGHSSHESQLQAKPQHESPNLNETPEQPKVCRWRAEGFTEVAVYAADLHRLGIQHG